MCGHRACGLGLCTRRAGFRRACLNRTPCPGAVNMAMFTCAHRMYLCSTCASRVMLLYSCSALHVRESGLPRARVMAFPVRESVLPVRESKLRKCPRFASFPLIVCHLYYESVLPVRESGPSPCASQGLPRARVGPPRARVALTCDLLVSLVRLVCIVVLSTSALTCLYTL